MLYKGNEKNNMKRERRDMKKSVLCLIMVCIMVAQFLGQAAINIIADNTVPEFQKVVEDEYLLFNATNGVAYDSKGYMYISGSEGLTVLDETYQIIAKFGTSEFANIDSTRPFSIAVDQDDSIYVGDSNGHVLKYDSNYNLVLQIDLTSEGSDKFNDHVRLAIDSKNRLYVSSTKSDQILVYTKEGQFEYNLDLSSVSKGSITGIHIEVNDQGHDVIYAVDHCFIHIIEGDKISSVNLKDDKNFTPTYDYVHDILIDRDNSKVYIAGSYNQALYVFDLDFNYLETITHFIDVNGVNTFLGFASHLAKNKNSGITVTGQMDIVKLDGNHNATYNVEYKPYRRYTDISKSDDDYWYGFDSANRRIDKYYKDTFVEQLDIFSKNNIILSADCKIASGNDIVYVYDPSTELLYGATDTTITNMKVHSWGYPFEVTTIELGSNGIVYTYDNNSGEFVVISLERGGIMNKRTTSPLNSKPRHIVDIEFMGDKMYLCDQLNSEVHVFQESGPYSDYTYLESHKVDATDQLMSIALEAKYIHVATPSTVITMTLDGEVIQSIVQRGPSDSGIKEIMSIDGSMGGIIVLPDSRTTYLWNTNNTYNFTKDPKLNDLFVKEGSIGNFNPDYNNYTVTTTSGAVSSITITATLTGSEDILHIDNQLAKDGVGVVVNLKAGQNKIPVSVTSSNQVKTNTYNIYVEGLESLDITTSKLPIGVIDVDYKTQVEVIGGDGDYTWMAHNLPNGFSIDSDTGLISGISNIPVNQKIIVTVVDGLGSTESKTMTLEILKATGGGAYHITPEVTSGVTFEITEAGTPQYVVTGDVTGLNFYPVSIRAVGGHVGEETVTFVQYRDGVQVGMTFMIMDIDGGVTLGGGFNVEPGDIIKILILDKLDSTGQSSNVL